MEVVNVPIRVLIVDDSADDALLLTDELQDNGYNPTQLRVDTPEAMTAALREQAWDIIIADYTMPQFSGPAALQVLHDSGLDIPLILVSGTAEEHIGIEMMRLGAQDFIIKHSLSRLAPAVTRELRETAGRRQQKRAEYAARTAAENYRMIFEYAPSAIVAFDHNGVILQVNPAFEQLYGFSAKEVVGRPMSETFGHSDYTESAKMITARVFTGEVIRNVELVDVRRDGTTVYVLANVTPVCDEQDQIIMAISMITDITERKLAEQHKREFYRRTISAFTDDKLLIAEPEEISAIATDPVESWEIDDIDDLGRMRSSVKQLLLTSKMDQHRVYNFVGAIVEAATNSLKHAGGGKASLHLHSDTAIFVVSDEGPGIDALALPNVALTKGYSTAATLGMGYKIMIQFADKVYLATGTKGTVVAIEMRFHAGQSPGDALLDKDSEW